MKEEMMIKKTIKQIIQEILDKKGIKLSSILLFGSRARGDFDKGSDWDLLVVIDKAISREENWEIAHIIRRKLADAFIPCDVLIKSEQEVEERKNVIGSVIRTAMKEGVRI